MRLTKKSRVIALLLFVVTLLLVCAIAVPLLQQEAYAETVDGTGKVKLYLRPIFPSGQDKLLATDTVLNLAVEVENDTEYTLGGFQFILNYDTEKFEQMSGSTTTAKKKYITEGDYCEIGALALQTAKVKSTITNSDGEDWCDDDGNPIKTMYLFTLKIPVKAGALSSGDKINFTFTDVKMTSFTKLVDEGNMIVDSVSENLELTVSGADSSLSALTVGGKAPTGGFEAGKSENQTVTFAEVPYSTTSVSIVATPSDSTASVSGAGTWNLANVGENTKTITVTHGTQSTTYTLKINRAKNTVAQLSSISVKDNGNTEYISGFSATNKNYTITVPYATDSVTYTASAINTATTTNASGTKSLAVGSNNKIEFEVTAQDGSTKDKYTVTIIRTAASTVNTLSALSVKFGTTELITAFSASTSEYTVTIPYKIEQLQIAATATDALAQGVSGDVGNVTLSKSDASKELKITVTAESGATKDYKVIVNRTPISSDATLKSLSVDGQNFTENFDPAKTRYDLSENILPTVTSLVVRAELNFADATLLINNDSSLASGSSIVLQDGEGVIFIKVTAQNGSVKDYEIHYNKATASADYTLKSLSVDSVAIQGFDRFTYSYQLQPVANDVESITISAEANDSKAAVAGIGGLDLENGSGEFALKVGTNEITIRVTAENGSTKDYVISVIRLEPVNPEAPKLDTLSVKAYGSDAELLVGSNLFDAEKTAYSLQVENSVTSVVIVANSEQHSVTGDTGVRQLTKIGANDFEIVVSNANDSTRYLITINRSAPLDTNALLQSLGVEGYDISPAFAEGIFSYTLEVPNATTSVTVNAVAKSPATLQNAVGSVNLDVGENEIEIVVVAQAGNKNTYKILVTRAKDSNESKNTFTATLKDATGKELLGSPDTNGNYTVTLNQKTGTLTLAVVADGDSAIAKIDDVGSGKTATLQISVASLKLYPSVNEYKITITPAQGTERTCILTIIVRVDDAPPVDSLATFVANEVEYEAVYDNAWNMYVVDCPSSSNTLTYTVNIQNYSYASILVGDRTWSVGEKFTCSGAVTAVLLTVTMPDGTKSTYPIMLRLYEPGNETPWVEFGNSSDSKLAISGISMRELRDTKTGVIIRSGSLTANANSVTFKTNTLPATTQLNVLYPNISLTKQTDVEGLIWVFTVSDLKEGNNVVVFTVYDEDLLLNKSVVLEIWKPITGDVSAKPVSIELPTAVVSGEKKILKFTGEDALSEESLKSLIITVTYEDGSVVTGLASELGATVVANAGDKTIKVTMTSDSNVTAQCNYEIAQSGGGNVGLIVALVLFIVIAVGASLVMVLFILKWRKATGKGHSSEE